jgi:hypothetical protein
MNIDRKESYNKYENLPLLSYNCIKYMMASDLIWRLLKYNDKDAYKIDADHPNLTTAQKGTLIYNGSAEVKNFRIFSDFGQDASWTEEVTILRITPVEIIPRNHIYGNVTIAMEIYTHYLINQLSNYQTRLNMISQQLIEIFNGQEIGGIGVLYFDARSGGRSRMGIGGETPFKGNILTFCNWI